MPNHVANKIEFYGDQENINKVIKLIDPESDEYIGFDKIIPMPKELNLTSGGYQNAAIQYALSKKTGNEMVKIQVQLSKRKCDFYGSYLGKAYAHDKYTSEKLQELADEFEEKLKSDERDAFDYVDYEGLGIKTFEDLGNAYIDRKAHV